jgi:MYXO-CTERM domain-containing protein
MSELRPARSMPTPALLVGLAIGLFGLATPWPAHAEFVLQAPPASISHDNAGNPQHQGPCGDEVTNPPATPSGIVTTFEEGQTITVTINEVIPLPGHWRVALGLTGPASLPSPPKVVASGSYACGAAATEAPPVFPVLGDNLLPAATGITGVQSTQITLPAGVTCNGCTLQVSHFRSNYGGNPLGGCFEYHCATISIVASEGGAGEGGAGEGGAGEGGVGEGGVGEGGVGEGGVGGTGPAVNGGASGTSPATSGGTGGTSPATSGGVGGAGPASNGGVSGTGPASNGGADGTGTGPASGGGTAGTSTSSASNGGAGTGSSPASSGCACSVPISSSRTPSLGFVGFFALAALMRRRRRR